MDSRIYSTYWSVDPLGWFVGEVDGPDDPLTLEPASGDAALQFSTFKKRDGDVTDEDLESFASEEGELDAACKVAYGPFLGLLLTSLHDTTWWRYWWLRMGPIHLMVTYNARIDVAARDHSIVNEILSTLRSQPG
jgi:hypothetical protein